ncbi:PQQ-binding-like beta-propeller repeat protein [Thalassoglobus sp.]|uniref:outer membrane protein assembly factor BamB family protein n=1 Tax=Thalassoglobus sp. TaxID=2795869 RepID=UPI003AA955F1
MLKTKQTILFLTMTFLLSSITSAEDWPQWRGTDRDAQWNEKGIIDAIPEEGLEVVWRQPINQGYSGPAVVGDKVYVTDYILKSGDPRNGPGTINQIQGTERVLCLNATDGELIWKHEYDCPYRISYPGGPRTTPTVDEDRVYTFGAEGHLFCFDRNSGDVLWSKQMRDEYKAKTPIWGFSSHPLVDGEFIYCVVGGDNSVAVALDKMTGEERWTALSASEPGYAPPSIVEVGKTRQLLIWDADNLNSLDPQTGEVYWTEELKPQYAMSIMAPQLSGDLLFASSIGDVGALYKLGSETPSADIVWRGTNRSAVYCANSTPFIDNGVIYGNDCRSGALVAVDIKDGHRLWTTFEATTTGRPASHGTAFIVKNQQTYFLFNEFGDLITAKLTPEAYVETGRFHVLEPTNEAFGRKVVWAHPAFANGHCFVRNDKEIVCVSLKADK